MYFYRDSSEHRPYKRIQYIEIRSEDGTIAMQLVPVELEADEQCVKFTLDEASLRKILDAIRIVDAQKYELYAPFRRFESVLGGSGMFDDLLKRFLNTKDQKAIQARQVWHQEKVAEIANRADALISSTDKFIESLGKFS